MRISDQEALDITPFVDQFTWTESMIAGGFSWNMRFKAEQWAEWDKLLFGRDRPTHQFRLRIEEDSGPQSTEWRTAIVDKSRAAFAQDASMVAEVKGADRRLDFAQITRTRAWNNRRVSDVIQQIAGEYGVQAAVETSSRTDSWTQVRENNWAFLRRIARSATTDSGRADTYLWLDEGTLRFGAPQLTDVSDRRYDMSVVESRVNDYAAVYNGREADRQGAARLRGVGFDFDLKRGLTFTMDAGTAATQPSLASLVPRRMEDGLRIYPVFEGSSEDVEEVVRSRWGRVAARYLTLRVTTRPDLTIMPNKIISMESNLDNKRATPYMGRYVVLEVRHVLEKESITTTLVCYRREAQEGEAQPTGANADTAGTRDQAQVAGRMPRTILTARELS